MKINKTNNPNFPYSISIRDKDFNFRSWKMSDKFSYLSVINKMKLEEHVTTEMAQSYAKELRQILVKNCLENDIPFTNDEYMYLLIAIRSVSVNHEIELTLECEKCSNEYPFILDLEKSFKAECSKFEIISVLNNDEQLIFEMNRINSQDTYDNYINKSQSPLEALYVDFVMHIQSVNDKILSSDEKFELFNSYDVGIFENIFTEWESQRFKSNNTATIQCPHCKNTETYSVDEVPGFYPQSWT